MLRLAQSWIWDFWLADDGDQFHLFFLQASRALHDPDRRHFRASVGHAVSADLIHWTQVADALVPADQPAFDDLAIWTGCTVPAPDGTWQMYYTGASRAEGGLVQRIGVVESDDLYVWRRTSSEAVLTADPRWYERLGDSSWPDQAWRDPWVFADPGGDGWHMLITARANTGPVDDRGVIGHARSDDLRHWTATAPLSEPGSGFGQLEVPQVTLVDGRPVLVFSCLRPELAQRRWTEGVTGGIWSVAGPSLTGPWPVADARALTDDRCYAGKLVRDRQGRLRLLAFRNRGDDGEFCGVLTDPMPLETTAAQEGIAWEMSMT